MRSPAGSAVFSGSEPKTPILGRQRLPARKPRGLAQGLDRPAWPGSLDLEFLADRFAHSHSASQLLPHLPSHWNFDILPPHRGHTKLMMDEMIYPLDSPGTMSTILIIALLSRDRQTTRGADTGHNNGNTPRGIYGCLALRTGWLRSPCRDQLPAASPDNENARAMPMPNSEQEVIAKLFLNAREY